MKKVNFSIKLTVIFKVRILLPGLVKLRLEKEEFNKISKMKTECVILFVVVLFFTYIGFFRLNHSVESNKDSTNKENVELMDRISENEVDDSNSNFYENNNVENKSCHKKYEDLVKFINNYMQRYVNLFLITSNLRNYEIKDFNEMISVDLEISLKAEDLAYLQNYSKNKKDSHYLKNFSKLDAILSEIARLKERTFAENALKASKSFFANFDYFSIIGMPAFYQFLSLLITVLFTWIIHHYIFHKSFYIFLGLTLNSMIFWESLIEYGKKINETKVEIFVENLKGMPEECNPANLRWYQSLWSYVSEDKCLQYHKKINKIPGEEISLFKCIIDTYSFYLIRTPLRLYGASVRDLTAEISALWPQPFRYFINLPFAPFFAIFLAIFILILLRKRLRLSFLGAAVEIGDSQRIEGNERPALTSLETSKTIRVIRKLKPWTKNRFPKRLEGSIGKRKKLSLRSSKSESELFTENE